MRGGWRPPPWFAAPARRIKFQRELDDLAAVTVRRSARYPGGFRIDFDIEPNGVPKKRVTVEFSPRSPNTARVFVDGPSDSPHRYDSGALCMWYPGDPRNLIWMPSDGASDLVARITVHLIKEQWYRTTGEWIGNEVRHDLRDNANDPKETT